MAATPLRLAVVGATGAVGRAVLEALSEREAALGSLRLLASERSGGERVEALGEEVAVEPVREGSFRGSDVAIFAAPAEVARAWVPRARAEGCAVVDCSPAFRDDPAVPLVVPELNASAISGARLVAVPDAATATLALALAPIAAAGGLDRVHATVHVPASAAGRRGERQLEEEVVALLNVREPEEGGALPQRMAFNLVPQVGSFGAGGYTEAETRLAAETRRVLGLPALRLAATAAWAPLFHCVSIAASVVTGRKLSADAARAALRAAPGLKLLDRPEEAGFLPMPELAAADEAVLVGRVREDPAEERGIELFAVAENTRRGAAANAVAVAFLVGEHRT